MVVSQSKAAAVIERGSSWRAVLCGMCWLCARALDYIREEARSVPRKGF